MSPEQAVAEARDGKLRPVYLVYGDERYLQTIVVAELRKAVIGAVDLGLNEDHFDAAEADVDAVISAARTLPMMAKHRLVIVRQVERWEPKTEGKTDGGKTDGGKGKAGALDRLADFVANAPPSTVLVLVGKLDARRRLVLLAKKAGYMVDCETPPRNAIPAWLSRRAKDREKTLAPGVAELLADIAGPELSRLDDAIERLALYVGPGPSEITEDSVAEVIVGVKPSSVWELVSAVGRRDLGAALATLSRVYDPKDRGLPLLGTLAWSTRQLVKFSAATARGLSPSDAARHAGAPPFKAADLAEQSRRITQAELAKWLRTLSEVDLALKGGSKRPPQAILESMVISLCGRKSGPHKARSEPRA
ncbi:MAG TPA: DNA polymerase III subunit delta [Polyangiaceae bacterium]